MTHDLPDWAKAITLTPEQEAKKKADIEAYEAKRQYCEVCKGNWVPMAGEVGCPWCEAEIEAAKVKKTRANGHAPDTVLRQVNLTAASGIRVRPVQWVWTGRMPLGALTLLGGREGIGKSTIAYTLAADVTKGELDGIYLGQPKAVIVAATEDSWEHTIVPRLMAAGADLDKVYRVDVTTDEGMTASLTLPLDLLALEVAVKEVDAVLILLDPLMSRLSAKLDTHKDAEVRIALEPLTSLADRCRAAVLGLIHVNKGVSTDPLTLLMGSRAFAAVARAVLFVMKDPDDESGNQKLMGTPKNNLGRTDLPTLAFSISSAHVATVEEGEVWTSRIDWQGESERSIDDAMESAGEGMEVRSAVTEATGWLEDYLMSVGGSDESSTVKREGAKLGHADRTLKRAAARLRVIVDISGYPRRSHWTLPIAVVSPPTEAGPTGPTGPIDQSGQILPSHRGGPIGPIGLTEGSVSGASGDNQDSPHASGPTDDPPSPAEERCPF